MATRLTSLVPLESADDRCGVRPGWVAVRPVATSTRRVRSGLFNLPSSARADGDDVVIDLDRLEQAPTTASATA